MLELLVRIIFADDDSSDWIDAYRRKYANRQKAQESLQKLEVIRKIEEKIQNLESDSLKRKRKFLPIQETVVDEDEVSEEESEEVSWDLKVFTRDTAFG